MCKKERTGEERTGEFKINYRCFLLLPSFLVFASAAGSSSPPLNISFIMAIGSDCIAICFSIWAFCSGSIPSCVCVVCGVVCCVFCVVLVDELVM